MNIERFREVIKRRTECHSEWYEGIEQCWKQEIELLSEDIQSTIAYLKNECTAEEYSWISEVIDDLAEKTQNRELIECYKELMTKFPNECAKYNISGSISFAEDALRSEVKHEED